VCGRLLFAVGVVGHVRLPLFGLDHREELPLFDLVSLLHQQLPLRAARA